jgi:hypothetical protein
MAKVTDLSSVRRHRAEVKAGYTDPFTALFDRMEASWRGYWVEHCRRTGVIIPFEEWFFEEDEDGNSPFEVAGFVPQSMLTPSTD